MEQRSAGIVAMILYWGGDLWIHITTSDRDGRGGFDIPGKPDIICSICGCRNPEPEL